jgi:hypothetical protein
MVMALYAAPMRRLALVVGTLAALAGLVFALQGVGFLPGSYMTGDRLWLIIGSIMVIAGIGLAAWGRTGGGVAG